MMKKSTSATISLMKIIHRHHWFVLPIRFFILLSNLTILELVSSKCLFMFSAIWFYLISSVSISCAAYVASLTLSSISSRALSCPYSYFQLSATTCLLLLPRVSSNSPSSPRLAGLFASRSSGTSAATRFAS